jgi:hypothetical protein
MKPFNINDQEWRTLKCDQVAECFDGVSKDAYVELWTRLDGEPDIVPTISEKWEKLSEAVQENIKIVLENYPECYFGDDDDRDMTGQDGCDGSTPAADMLTPGY